ncbi:hypothetical protein [Camelimonas lactis]|uniref:hypothetical protein n=1 Tax=Camelimonas lactis TaxID=659006 RepID=UPI001404A69B|nr:hypothetical protein [Camelimonas lactis]
MRATLHLRDIMGEEATRPEKPVGQWRFMREIRGGSGSGGGGGRRRVGAGLLFAPLLF